jgi:hypothetical protein
MGLQAQVFSTALLQLKPRFLAKWKTFNVHDFSSYLVVSSSASGIVLGSCRVVLSPMMSHYTLMWSCMHPSCIHLLHYRLAVANLLHVLY